jgi:3-oxoacyl-[acyl-carrier protein] reductase
MKTCIITGAGSGIGRSTAIDLSNRDIFDTLVIIGKNEKNLDDTYESMNKEKNIKKIVYDLVDLEGVPNLVADIYKECNSIDCLLNIAGFADPQPLLNTTLYNMQYTYSINVFAPFMLIRECVKYMKNNKNGAKILNVASTAGSTPRPGWLSYSSSKASLISMSQTLSEELSEYNIKVYCISPGRCATALRKKLAPEEDPTSIMQPEDVSKIICNLVSDTECCLDGQNIVIRRKTN